MRELFEIGIEIEGLVDFIEEKTFDLDPENDCETYSNEDWRRFLMDCVFLKY